MKRYVACVLYLLLIFTFGACSKYYTKTIIKKKSNLSSLKSGGVIIRLSKDSHIDFTKINTNVSNWLRGLKLNVKLQVIDDASDKIKIYESAYDRFYHLSENLDFLEFKSLGQINQYLSSNEDELKKIFAEKNIDNLIFYEIDSTLSIEMRMMDFKSIIFIIDRNFNIIFMDHQKNAYPERRTTWDLIAYGDVRDDIDYFNNEELKNLFFDKVTERLLNKLDDLNYIQ